VTKKVEKTFTVAVPVARAWEAFADSHERSQWEAVEYEIDPRPGGLLRWTLPGIEATGRVEEVQVHHLLRHTELTGPHAGCEVTVGFEEVTGGTRITITHAGFGWPNSGTNGSRAPRSAGPRRSPISSCTSTRESRPAASRPRCSPRA
jgi:uncharacterized protein YndB with AHSA1/START domain